jgi:predicted TIM-barrel fold metal-dependent hydrolase
MIFDGHAYCFPSLLGPAGFSSKEVLWRHLQHAMATHFQPVWRSRDRAPGDNIGLIDRSNWSSLEGLKEAHFRAAGLGRFEWTVDGEDYVKQYFPPSITDMSYSAESLVAEMDYAGVDRALLHRTPYLGIGNDFTADCVQRFPDRLVGLAHVEEWLVEPEPEAAIASLEKAVRQQGLSGLQFLTPQADLYGRSGPWDGDGFRPFWDGVAGLNIPVFISLNPRDDPPLESYLEELKTLERWMALYPDVTVVLTHGLSWMMFREDDRIKLPEAVWAPFDNPKLHLQLLFPIGLGLFWDYPMAQIRPTIAECVDRVGADRLMWGTDMPIVMRYWTYRQNIDFIRCYCDFLTPQQLDAILGGTTARLLGMD